MYPFFQDYNKKDQIPTQPIKSHEMTPNGLN
jgi:hypothetical protein